MKLLLVESPSKAKVLSKYLNDYDVMATYGHIREITKEMAIDVNNQFQVEWSIKRKLKIDIDKYDDIILATDPDREGEAIAWHIISVFNIQNAKRISFNSVTEKSLKEALKSPREIDLSLVDAYLARIKLDYLVGFSISPILWRKLPGTKSAGRVQSIALRLLSERELEIKSFVPDEYYDIYMYFENYKAKLESYNNIKIIKDITCYDEIISKEYCIENIITTQKKISPKAPFITSTLQQAASTELSFSPDKTMQIAQSLYEGKNDLCEGLITYMRTDSTNINEDFIIDLRKYVKELYPSLISDVVNIYKSKVKNSQEAHEAIRITNLEYTPISIKGKLPEEQYKLYNLIWNRTISSQMKESIYESTKYIISHQDIIFSMSISNLIFRGYQFQSEETYNKYPLSIGDKIKIDKWEKIHKYTTPPNRYSEASLIKELEKRGIGRPSTYARIINVLKERDYVINSSTSLIPNNKGIIVCEFLKLYFTKYVNYDFTTQMEENLDLIANNKKSSLELLSDFWNIFSKNIEYAKELNILDILSNINNALRGKLYKENILCCNEYMTLRISKGYPFLQCAKCNQVYCLNENKYVQDEVIFKYHDRDVIKKYGRYGQYLEWIDDKGKRIRTPNVEYEEFKILASLPKIISKYNDQNVFLKYGRYGYYLFFNEQNIAIPSKINIFSLNEHEINNIIADKLKKITNL